MLACVFIIPFYLLRKVIKEDTPLLPVVPRGNQSYDDSQDSRLKYGYTKTIFLPTYDADVSMSGVKYGGYPVQSTTYKIHCVP